MRTDDDTAADRADWDQLAHAMADLATGVRRRWAATGADLDGKRAGRHGRALTDLTTALDALAGAIGDPRFAGSARPADVALARALAGPLAALGEDLRPAVRNGGGRDRYPADED